MVTFSKRRLEITGATALAVASLYILKKYGPSVGRRILNKLQHGRKARLAMVESSSGSKVNQRTASLDSTFILQAWRLLKILFPGIWTKQVGLLLLHSVCLFVRTFLSIYVATLDGRIIRSVVQKNVFKFVLLLTNWIGVAIPATFINSMIRYLESKLSLAFRTELVNYAYDNYFSNQTYYRVGNLDGRLANADECLTEDIRMFCSSVAHLYSHLTKPCLDIFVICWTLDGMARKRGTSWKVPVTIAAVVIYLTAEILRKLSPRFGKIVAEESQRRGQLRFLHSRVITNAEEIAFYGGHKVELSLLKQSFQSLAQQMELLFSKRLWFIMLEQFLMKYVWSASGLVMVGSSILTGKGTEKEQLRPADQGVSERTEHVTTSRSLMVSAADAIERVMSSYKEIIELSGYTARVSEMLDVFEDVQQGHCERQISRELTQVEDSLLEEKEHSSVGVHGEVVDLNQMPGGEVVDTEGSIVLKDVAIITPCGDVVVSSLSFEVSYEMNQVMVDNDYTTKWSQIQSENVRSSCLDSNLTDKSLSSRSVS